MARPMWEIYGVVGALALTLSGCGGGGATPSPTPVSHCAKKITMTPDLADMPYTKMMVSDGISADVSNGTAKNISVTLCPEARQYLQVIVKGGVLSLSVDISQCWVKRVDCTGISAKINTMAPLVGAIAYSGSHVIIDKLHGNAEVHGGSGARFGEVVVLDGSVVLTGGSKTFIGWLGGSKVQLSSNGGAALTVSSGAVSGSVSAKSFAGSNIHLGSVAVPVGSIVASGGAHVDGMSSETLHVTSTGGSSITTTSEGIASGICSGGGSVSIRGGADTTSVKASGGCHIIKGSVDLLVPL